MDPSDKIPNIPVDVVKQALVETSPDLSLYAADFFTSPDLVAASKAITAILEDTSEEAMLVRDETWAQYENAVSEVIAQALHEGGEPAMDRAVLSSSIHKAMIYKVVDDNVRYFGELQNAEDYTYNTDSDALEELAEKIHDVLDTLLIDMNVNFDTVIGTLLIGTETDENERVKNGLVSKWEGDDPRDDLPEVIVENQLAIEEEYANGADLVEILGDVYRAFVASGEDPVPFFEQLGFSKAL